MTTWYVSGPITGRPDFNFPMFDRVERYLKSLGVEVRNPAGHFDGDTTLKRSTYMRKDIDVLLGCTDVVFLPGWQNSRGARVEHAVAVELDLGLWQWLDGDVEALDAEPVELQASDLVRNGERQQVYGHPAEDFTRTAAIWSAILGTKVSAEDVALMMVGLKMSRLVATPGHKDSITDMIGYSICLDRVSQYLDGDEES